MTEEKKRVVHVIVNPAAGQDQPFLKTLNSTFMDAGMDYEVMITKDAGDARRLAQEAAAQGVDVVAAYGGDGTVIEVASGLIGTSVPLAILPGGTGNMMSKAFGISQDFAEACALITHPETERRCVSLARLNDIYFFQLAGIGLEAKMVEGADRGAKDRLGMLAYGVAALQALTDPVVSTYRITIDDQPVEIEGVTCLIGIVTNMGRPGLEKALGTAEHRDRLDVMVLEKANLPLILSLLQTVTGSEPNAEGLHHWYGRKVHVEVDPPQVVQADGEVLGEVAVDVEILPNCIQLLVPPGDSSGQG